MTATRIVTPRLRLSEEIRAPGGLTIDEAVARTEQGLEEIKAQCATELGALLQAAEGAFAALGGEGDVERMSEIYVAARRAVGGGAVCDRPQLDVVLVGLCDLLQSLMRRDAAGGPDAIAVHLDAWRLIVIDAPPSEALEPLLEGLAGVRSRFDGHGAPKPTSD